jgi:hypothetical protein
MIEDVDDDMKRSGRNSKQGGKKITANVKLLTLGRGGARKSVITKISPIVLENDLAAGREREA